MSDSLSEFSSVLSKLTGLRPPALPGCRQCGKRVYLRARLSENIKTGND